MSTLGQYNRQESHPSRAQAVRPLTDIDYQRETAHSPPRKQIIISDPPQSSRNLNPERSKLVFEGFAFELEVFLREKRREDFLGVTQAEVVLIGQQVKGVNRCVPFCCGFVGAYLYCLCNCLFCCSCRQKVVYNLYEVHQLGYENILRLVQACPNLLVLKLRVRDNVLNQSKAAVLEDALKIGTVKRFELLNQAVGVSIEPDTSFQDFALHFKRLKLLRIETAIRWEDTVVT